MGALDLKAGSPLAMGLAIAGGFALDHFVGVNSMIDGLLPGTISTPASGTTPATHTPTTIMNNVAMAGEIGLGGYLMLSKGKSMIKTLGGGALVGLGLHRLAVEMKLISGFMDYPVIGNRVRGFQDYPVIGGLPNALNGLPNSLSGGYASKNGMGGYRPIGSGSRVLAGFGEDDGGYISGSDCMS